MSEIARARALVTSLLAVLCLACTGPAAEEDSAPGQSGANLGELRPDQAGISATLSASKAAFAATDPVAVTLTLRNTGRTTVQFLRWFGPSTELQAPLFAVSRGGLSLPYTGPLVKRAAPSSDDLLSLAPGQAVSAEVSLDGAYDLSVTGAYSIRYQVGALGSNALSLQVEGRLPVQPSLSPDQVAINGRITYRGCTPAQQGVLSGALDQATAYATGSLDSLNATAPSGTPRYTTWFGAFSSAGWSKAQADYAAIQDAFITKPITFWCTCHQNHYAYVQRTHPYEIHLCNIFWTVPPSGTDSQGGTLVHEMSHFDETASTDDWAYGQAACKDLALSDPTKALDNADTHEYFAENNPAQQ